MKRIAIQELIELQQKVTTFKATFQEVIENNKMQVDNVCMLEGFQGQAADAAKGYFMDVHGTILRAMGDILTEYETVTSSIPNDFQTNVVVDDGAVITLEHLERLGQEVRQSSEMFRQLDAQVSQEVNSIEDIISISYQRKYEVITQNNQQVLDFQLLGEKIVAFESAMNTKYQGVLQKINDVQSLIKMSSTSVSNSVIQYTSGMYAASIAPLKPFEDGDFQYPFISDENNIMYRQLVELYGFSPSRRDGNGKYIQGDAETLTNLYHKIMTTGEVDNYIPDTNPLPFLTNRRFSREALFFNVIASFVYYDDNGMQGNMWNVDVGILDMDTKNELLEKLGYNTTDIGIISKIIKDQAKTADTSGHSDFAHFSATMFAEMDPKDVLYIDDNRAGWAGDLGAIDGHYVKNCHSFLIVGQG